MVNLLSETLRKSHCKFLMYRTIIKSQLGQFIVHGNLHLHLTSGLGVVFTLVVVVVDLCLVVVTRVFIFLHFTFESFSIAIDIAKQKLLYKRC